MPAKRILLIDDEPNVVKSCARMLELEGFAVDGVTGGKEALDLYRRESFDLVLTDLKMPEFDGLVALQVFQDSGVDIPFILVSGAIGEDLAVTAMKAGVHDYIMKGNLKRLPVAVEREMREAEVRRQRVDVDRLARQHRPVGDIALAPALGLAQIAPVGRPITGALMPRDLHKGFQQHRSLAVARGKVLGHLTCRQRQDLGPQIAHLDPG